MKKKTKKNIMSIFLIIVFVFISVILADKSYNLKNYESLSYKETIATNYKVYLSDNSYYNTQYLDEGMQYISNIIPEIHRRLCGRKRGRTQAQRHGIHARRRICSRNGRREPGPFRIRPVQRRREIRRRLQHRHPGRQMDLHRHPPVGLQRL